MHVLCWSFAVLVFSCVQAKLPNTPPEKGVSQAEVRRYVDQIQELKKQQAVYDRKLQEATVLYEVRIVHCL